MISISLCMIVRDEEKVLGRCLDSVRELADEIIIVDTGSRDRKKEIAGKYTDKIYDFRWEDDFSAARNFAFARASGAYCMWMDADDVMPESSRKPFLELKASLTSETDVVMMPYETAFDERGKTVFSYYRERIVKNHPCFRFQGKVHEVIPLKGKIKKADIPIEHRKEDTKDSDRNLQIYEKMEKAGEVFDCRMLYYYGRELIAHGRYEEGLRRMEQFLDRPEGWLENKIDATRQMALCYYRMGNERQAFNALVSGFLYDVPRGETCCDLGRHFLDRGQYEKAAYWYRRALEGKKDPKSGAFIQEECYGFLPAISLCVCYDRMGEREKAEQYNELAGYYKPYSEYYLQNKEYFKMQQSPEMEKVQT